MSRSPFPWSLIPSSTKLSHRFLDILHRRSSIFPKQHLLSSAPHFAFSHAHLYRDRIRVHAVCDHICVGFHLKNRRLCGFEFLHPPVCASSAARQFLSVSKPTRRPSSPSSRFFVRFARRRTSVVTERHRHIIAPHRGACGDAARGVEEEVRRAWTSRGHRVSRCLSRVSSYDDARCAGEGANDAHVPMGGVDAFDERASRASGCAEL